MLTRFLLLPLVPVVIVMAAAYGTIYWQSLEPPSPSSANASQEAKAGSKAKEKATTKGKPGSEANPLFVYVVPGPDKAPTTKEETKGDYSRTSPEWWLVYVTIPLTAFTLGLMAYTLLLWRATGELVADTSKNARHQLRAYIALDDIYFPWMPHADDPSDRSIIVPKSVVKVRIKNFGNTPAKNLQLRLGGIMAAYEGIFERKYAGRNYIGSKLILSPTQTYATRLSKDLFTFDPIKPADDAGREPFIFGAIVYQDIYDRWWLHHFCYHYDSDPASKNRFIPHSDYNYEKQYQSEDDALNSLSYDLPDTAYRGGWSGRKWVKNGRA